MSRTREDYMNFLDEVSRRLNAINRTGKGFVSGHTFSIYDPIGFERAYQRWINNEDSGSSVYERLGGNPDDIVIKPIRKKVKVSFKKKNKRKKSIVKLTTTSPRVKSVLVARPYRENKGMKIKAIESKNYWKE